MTIEFVGCEWDSGNWPKCGKHGVSQNEIEAVLAGPVFVLPDVSHSQVETRFLAIGTTSMGRHVFVCFTIRHRSGDQYVRPISARYMRQKEVDAFEKTHPQLGV